MLKTPELPAIWCEFKRPGKTPEVDQEKLGERLKLLGHWWFWTTSVMDYYLWLRANGVPLHRNAEFLAMHHDGSVATEIAKAEAKAGVPRKASKPRAMKPSAAHIRRVTGILRNVGRA
jgi:hypothetical protein